MFEYIYFIGTGCGRPLSNRQLPGYLVGLPDGQSILLECGCTISTDATFSPVNIAQLDAILITALNIELFAGLLSLLHSMRLMNRAKTLMIVAPNRLNNIVSEMWTFDKLTPKFAIEFIPIEDTGAPLSIGGVRVFTREASSVPNKFQVFLQTEPDNHQATIFYTGKATGISDESLLIGHKFIIHDCTYSYDDHYLTAKTGLGSYKDVLTIAEETGPTAIFLVHFSTRYKDPHAEIDKGRPRFGNIIKAYDGYRYDFLWLSNAIDR